jgi:hypothetical protein
MLMRDEFRDIIAGWLLVDDLNYVTEKIEAAAEWTKLNRPLWPDEEATIKCMIERQIVLGFELHDFSGAPE